MSEVKIDGTGYNYDDLSDLAKLQLKKISYIKKEYVTLRTKMDILKTAEAGYYSILKKEIEKK